MKKSSFVALLLGTVSVALFGLGMCMATIPEWAAFRPGVALGTPGLVLALVTLLLWRRMEHKGPVRLSARTLGTAALAAVGALALGVGMCCCMMWDKLVLGVAVGLVGIALLICLVPLTKGIRE